MRTDVVGIFPDDGSLIRLAASVVIEQNDEWLVGRRYLSNHSLEASRATPDDPRADLSLRIGFENSDRDLGSGTT